MAVVTAAATTAILAYLDAKLHLRKDLRAINGRKMFQDALGQAIKQKRLSIYYLFEAQAKQKGDEECIWSRTGSVSWRQALDRVHQYAQLFLSHGIQPGERVAFFMRNSPDFPLAWVGLWAIGAYPAMINISLAGHALLHCINIAQVKLILAEGDDVQLSRIDAVKQELAKSGIKVLRLNDVRGELYSSAPVRPPDSLRERVTPTTPAGLFYTSGTTGLPKACILPVPAVFRGSMAAKFGDVPVLPEGNDRCYICMPFYHGTGGITGMNLILGGTTVCMAPKFSVSGFWDDIRESRATWFIYVGETLRYLLSAPPSPRDKDHSVHAVFGNGCRPDVWNRFQDRFGIPMIFEMFAQTEGMLHLYNPARNEFFQHCVGHEGYLLRRNRRNLYAAVETDLETGDIIRDPKTGFAKRLPLETGGEILLAVPGERIFGGYYGNAAATEKKYARDVFKKGDCFYRTGDALRRDSEGRWFFMDRLGDTFRWKGENVSTAEVAEVLGKYPGVHEALVYGVSLPGHDGKAGAAALFISPDQKEKFDYSGLLKYTRDRLPHYAVPIFIRVLADHMASHNNKQNKMPLKKDGVHPDVVIKSGDTVLWIDQNGKGSTYAPFTLEDWDALGAGKAKL